MFDGSALTAHAKLWFFTGSMRIRLPVAAKRALSTAGARKLVTGTSMMVAVPNEDQRKAIIAYLKSVTAQGN